MKSLARSEGRLDGDTSLDHFERLLQAVYTPDGPAAGLGVHWQARAELRPDAQGQDTEIWLHLEASATLPLQCQRCLGPVPVPLVVDRWFRFVVDEATAENEDDDSEEDLLVLQPSMSLFELIEDELLMAFPLVPMHDSCPDGVVLRSGDAAMADPPSPMEKVNPFAVLAQWKK